MSLVRGLSTTSTKKRKASKKNAKSTAEHDRWLMKMGAHPSQRKKKSGINRIPDYKTPENLPLSNSVVPIDPYQGMSAEEKIAATRSVALGQLYNKGGIQVIGKSDNTVAGKRRV